MAYTDRPVVSDILYDENGTALRVPKGALGSEIIERLVARGDIPGYSSTAFGYVATAATTIVAVRATAYTELGSAQRLEMVSSSASDAAAGTGTRSVRITWFDGSMNGPFTEDVILNGTTAVGTVATTMRFIDKVETLTAGSNGTNVGTLTLRVFGAGATVGTIAVSDGITFWGHHYVAPSRTCYITDLIAGANGVSQNFFLRSIPPLTANSFDKQIISAIRTITAQPSQLYQHNNLWVVGPARITAYVRPDAATASTSYINIGFHEV